MERQVPKLPTLGSIFCCFPLTIGAFMLGLVEIGVSAARIAVIKTKPNTCAAFEDKFLFFTCLANTRYFCDELPETYNILFLLEIFLNGGQIVAALCLMLGSCVSSRILAGLYLYWTALMVLLRLITYFLNVIPLYKTYTEQDFTIMLWGGFCIGISAICWIWGYSYLESIPIPIKPKKKYP